MVLRDKNSKNKPYKNRTFFDSFRYAFQGVCTVFQEERNMRFHVLSSLAILFISAFLTVTTVFTSLIKSLNNILCPWFLIASSIDLTRRPSNSAWVYPFVLSAIIFNSLLVISFCKLDFSKCIFITFIMPLYVI